MSSSLVNVTVHLLFLLIFESYNKNTICTVLLHYYYIYDMNSYQDIRRKAARLIAAKCALAARVDGFHEDPEGLVGQSKEFRV